MESFKSKSISAALATATCTLLGTSVAAPVLAQEEPAWVFNTALLYYGEADGRIQDGSVKGLVQRRFVDDRVLSIGFAVDALTGATPNGAIPFDGVQTFTAPSGESTYKTAPGDMPKDDSFQDVRASLTVNWSQPLGRLFTINAGLSGSSEFDYTHYGANLGFTRDLNKRNTTLSLGIAASRDAISPVGGVPIPFSSMLDRSKQREDGPRPPNRTGDQTKDVYDVVFGVTQVVNRNLLVQLDYSLSASSGYLNDPYKILSLVDAVTGDPLPRTPVPGKKGPVHQYRYENRPDSHVKQSFYGQAKLFMGGKVLDASYRFMTDDWGIHSHTVDTHFRVPFTNGNYLEPHFRYYTQTAADFYQISLVDGTQAFTFASADYRLGDFDAFTVGLKYGWKSRFGKEMSLRLEYYKQNGNAPAEQVIGNQAGRVLYPDLDAIIAQFSYQFEL